MGCQRTALVVGVVLLQAMTAAAEEPTSIQEVVVTGSRIKRDSGFDYPVPVAVIGGDDIRDSGYTAIGDALANLPQALATTGIQNTSGTLFNAGQSRANLRGLGTQRTLVLVDGRRHVTGDFQTSAVDLNVIPSSMVERIEAISGGASAVYGSEAIAGVVNIILRKKMQGLVLDVQGGQTDKNDGGEWTASAGYGFNFANERAHFLIGAEYTKADPIMQVDRDWAFPGVRRNTSLASQTVVPQSRSNTMPTATFQLINSGNPAIARSASIALDRGSVFENSALCRTATVNALCQDSDLFYANSYNALQGGVKRATARSYLGFDLTDNVTLYTDISYAHVDGFGIFQPAFSNALGGGTLPAVIHGDNAYLNGSTALDTQLRGFWTGAGLPLTQASTVNVGKFWQEFGDRDTDTVRENYRAVAGIQGKFNWLGRKADYEVYGQYGELDGYSLGFNVPNIKRTLQELDAVQVGGQIVCRDAAARAAGCQPWDLINGPSAAAVSWANANARSNGMANQTIAAANLSTSLFDLPAGPLGLAIGGEFRNETSDQIQDPLSASGALFYNAIGRTQGKYHLSEGYAEIAIPLLKNLPFAQQLSFEAAGRLGSYSTVGHTNQWRLALEWAPVDDVRFRASDASAVRAPNIAELYGPQGQNFTNVADDPCDAAQIAGIPASDTARRTRRIANCTAAIPGYNPATFSSNFGVGRPSLALLQGGNPNLAAEVARTYTAGFVIQPRWLRSLEFSTDYWLINVDGAISTIPINTLLQNLCYDSAESYNANKFCGLIHRDATGAATYVELTNQNVQALKTSGIDTSLSYHFDAKSLGLYQFRLDGTKIIRWDLQGVPGGATTHYAGVLTGVNSATPRYKLNGSIGWDLRDFVFRWESHWYSSMAVSETLAQTALTPFYTGSYWEHDLHATYKVNDSLSVRAGAINVTNAHPPIIPEVGAATGVTTSVYDNRGRWYFLGVNYKRQ
ncbi:MAG: TonB-dependent receptor [Proteobacteria bacterium]|nr:TonB-dependent receptor [Pseudomonadota bacterium]